MSFNTNEQRSLRGHSRWETMVHGYHRTKYRGWNKSGHVYFTSKPLEQPLKIAGMVSVTLYVSTNDTEADLFAYLTVLRPQSSQPRYITEGQIRLSHRKELPVGLGTLLEPDLIQRSYYSTDQQPVEAGKVYCVRFDLLPTCYLFQEGSQIQLRVSGQDAEHFEAVDENRKVTLHFGNGERNASIKLPVIPIVSKDTVSV